MEFDDKSKMTMFDVDGKNVSRAEFYLVDGETHGHKPLMLELFWTVYNHRSFESGILTADLEKKL